MAFIFQAAFLEIRPLTLGPWRVFVATGWHSFSQAHIVFSDNCFNSLFSGTTGFLNNVRAFLWIPIQQYTTRRIQLKFLRHLHR